jgi:hypothetical protein
MGCRPDQAVSTADAPPIPDEVVALQRLSPLCQKRSLTVALLRPLARYAYGSSEEPSCPTRDWSKHAAASEFWQDLVQPLCELRQMLLGDPREQVVFNVIKHVVGDKILKPTSLSACKYFASAIMVNSPHRKKKRSGIALMPLARHASEEPDWSAEQRMLSQALRQHNSTRVRRLSAIVLASIRV